MKDIQAFVSNEFHRTGESVSIRTIVQFYKERGFNERLIRAEVQDLLAKGVLKLTPRLRVTT